VVSAEPDLTGVPAPPEEWLADCAPGDRNAAGHGWRVGWGSCRDMVIAQGGPKDPIGALTSNAISQHELYQSYIDSGFTPTAALHLLAVTILGSMLAP
jgi:hypothetical protein